MQADKEQQVFLQAPMHEANMLHGAFLPSWKRRKRTVEADGRARGKKRNELRRHYKNDPCRPVGDQKSGLKR